MRTVNKSKDKRIAVFHNYLDNIGGAEKVGLTLARDLPADIYTTVANKTAIRKMGFNQKVRRIGWIPVNAPFRQQLALLRFRHLNLKNKYDQFIIDGDWAMSGSVLNKPNIWYVHSPIREIWDLYNYTRKNNVSPIKRPAFDAWVLYNRHLNKKYVKHVNRLVCNSENVKQRIKKYLKRNAKVINPPIDTKEYEFKSYGNYWLAVNRLITHKRVELQLKAFAKMPKKKLIIVGSFEQSKHFLAYKKYLMKIKPPNVTILHHVDDNIIKDLYANARGFITTSKNEDFGMTPVEAMSCGKPVIAPNEGGYKETVIDGETGILINNINVEKLVEAVKDIDKNPEQYKKACLKRAKQFDTKVFIKRMREELNQL